MKTENIVLIVVLAIVAALVVYNFVKKEEYYMPHIFGGVNVPDQYYTNDRFVEAIKDKAERMCKDEFGWDGKTVKKFGCDDSISYQKNKRNCNSVYCDVNVELLKREQPEKYRKWKGWF